MPSNLVFIQDNATIHKTEARDKVEYLFLPPCTS